MLVARLIEVIVPLAGVGFLMLVAVRFIRGGKPENKTGGWLYSAAMWRLLGRIFLGFGIYFFVTRFFRR